MRLGKDSTRGRFFEEEAYAMRMDHGDAPSSYGERCYRNDRAGCAAYIEVLLFAPRITFESLRDLKILRNFDGVSGDLAARIVHTLFDSPKEQAIADTGYAHYPVEVRRFR